MLSISDNTQAYVYNTRNSTDNCDNPGCYSYYSWHAATAGSGVDITTANTDAPYSICPKGWKLPNATSPQGIYTLPTLAFIKTVLQSAVSPDNHFPFSMI